MRSRGRSLSFLTSSYASWRVIPLKLHSFPWKRSSSSFPRSIFWYDFVFMTQHIGIVGCSAEGAALCYRTICLEAEPLMGKHAHPEVTMHTIALAEYMKPIDAGAGWEQPVAELMLRSAQALKRAGADFLICPDNTIHQALAYVLPRSPLPWLHIAEEVGREAKRRGFRKLGITGTRFLVSGPVYAEKLEQMGIA